MMKGIKVCVRLIGLIVVTFYFYLLILLRYPLKYAGVDSLGWGAKMRSKWGKYVCKVVGAEIVIKGTPPETPFFLVSNHLSYADIWVLYSKLKCTFIAKSELKKWPLIGFMLATSGIIFVDRSKRSDVRRVNDEISRNLNEHQGIALFPEGTTSAGSSLLPFKSALLQFPAYKNIPVHSASINYETHPKDKPAFQMISWWDDTPFPVHFLRLLTLRKWKATITYAEEAVSSDNRKLLTLQAREQIESVFEPTVSEKELQEYSS
jgi:1-acyl-sn-glycerol-3-phosphate acyltransferase